MSKLSDLQGQTIAVGVGGGIAAYKSLEIIRSLRKMGAQVFALPTRNALQFVGELSFEALSGQPCFSNPLNVRDGQISHIELAEKANAFVVAPATADLIAKMAHGMADELLLQTLLSFRGTCIIAPAMETRMWEHDATQKNIEILRDRGCIIVGPESGSLASGRTGLGRMAETDAILEELLATFVPNDFWGKRVLVTAGPTVEDLDPVRFISNRSSGKMGTAIARALAFRGAQVELVHGPMSTKIPQNTNLKSHRVRSAAQMFDKVMDLISECEVAILCAAVADFTPTNAQLHKIKKSQETQTSFSFSKTKDILKAVGSLSKRPFLVGFAAETEDVESEAIRKCIDKNCDLVCGNLVSGEQGTLDSDLAQMVVVDQKSRTTLLKRASKNEIAHSILDMVQERTHFLTN